MTDSVIWCNKGWQPVCFGFCPSKKAWDREMKRLSCTVPYPTSDASTTTFALRKGNDVCVIVTVAAHTKSRPLSAIVGLIVHEAAHVWQDIRKCMQETHPSTEFEAYAMQAIAQELFVAYTKTRGKHRYA